MKEIISPILREPRKAKIEPVWDKNSKVLIVGSITATDGMKKGFFYASARNQLWELVDYALGTTDENDSFQALKNKLKENYDLLSWGKISQEQFEKQKESIKQEFNTKLKANNIAICDIFRSCYFNNNSSLDNDIILSNPAFPYETCKEELQEIISNSHIDTVIVNSKFVEKQFIRLDIKGDYDIKYAISPSPRKGSIDSKKQQWKEVFSCCGTEN